MVEYVMVSFSQSEFMKNSDNADCSSYEIPTEKIEVEGTDGIFFWSEFLMEKQTASEFLSNFKSF